MPAPRFLAVGPAVALALLGTHPASVLPSSGPAPATIIPRATAPAEPLVASWTLTSSTGSCVPDNQAGGDPACTDTLFSHVTLTAAGATFNDETSAVPPIEGGRLDIATCTACDLGTRDGWIAVTVQRHADCHANIFQAGTTKGGVGGAPFAKIQFGDHGSNTCAVPNCSFTDDQNHHLELFGLATLAPDVKHTLVCERRGATAVLWVDGVQVASKSGLTGSVDLSGYSWTVGAKGDPDGLWVDHTDELSGIVSSISVGVQS